MDPVVGKDAKLYRNTGTYDVPVWDEVIKVMDLTVNLPKGEADITTRGAGFRRTAPGLKDASIEFGYLHETGAADAHQQAWIDAFFNDTTVDLAAMDQDIATSGAQGLRFVGTVVDLTQDQSLEEGLKYNVSVKPTFARDALSDIIEPEWLVTP